MKFPKAFLVYIICVEKRKTLWDYYMSTSSKISVLSKKYSIFQFFPIYKVTPYFTFGTAVSGVSKVYLSSYLSWLPILIRSCLLFDIISNDIYSVLYELWCRRASRMGGGGIYSLPSKKKESLNRPFAQNAK